MKLYGSIVLKFIRSNDRISRFNTSFETVAYLGTKQNLFLYLNSNQHFDRPARFLFFTRSGHCNILLWRSYYFEFNDAIHLWFRPAVNELWSIKDFNFSFLPSLDLRAFILLDELFSSFPFKCSFLYNSFSTV